MPGGMTMVMPGGGVGVTVTAWKGFPRQRGFQRHSEWFPRAFQALPETFPIAFQELSCLRVFQKLSETFPVAVRELSKSCPRAFSELSPKGVRCPIAFPELSDGRLGWSWSCPLLPSPGVTVVVPPRKKTISKRPLQF